MALSHQRPLLPVPGLLWVQEEQGGVTGTLQEGVLAVDTTPAARTSHFTTRDPGSPCLAPGGLQCHTGAGAPGLTSWAPESSRGLGAPPALSRPEPAVHSCRVAGPPRAYLHLDLLPVLLRELLPTLLIQLLKDAPVYSQAVIDLGEELLYVGVVGAQYAVADLYELDGRGQAQVLSGLGTRCLES